MYYLLLNLLSAEYKTIRVVLFTLLISMKICAGGACEHICV